MKRGRHQHSTPYDKITPPAASPYSNWNTERPNQFLYPFSTFPFPFHPLYSSPSPSLSLHLFQCHSAILFASVLLKPQRSVLYSSEAPPSSTHSQLVNEGLLPLALLPSPRPAPTSPALPAIHTSSTIQMKREIESCHRFPDPPDTLPAIETSSVYKRGKASEDTHWGGEDTVLRPN